MKVLAGAATTRFLYDGAEVVGEFTTSGTLLRRYVPGPGLDDAAAWYEGAGTSDRRWLLADERGSVVGWANGAGALGAAYAYDEYGQPNGHGANTGDRRWLIQDRMGSVIGGAPTPPLSALRRSVECRRRVIQRR